MEEDNNKIEDLKKVLYSRNSKLPDTLILDLKKHPGEVDPNWKQEETEKLLFVEEPKKTKNISLIVFMFALTFFVISVFVAGFIYFRGANVISANNIAVDVIGPQTVGAGEVLSLDVALTNNNDSALILADLLIEYPKGTRNAEDKKTELVRERIPVGTIEAHQTVRKNIEALIFEEEGEISVIKYSLEYRLENSGSVFTYNGEYQVSIGSAPVSMNVTMLKEVNADQELVIDVLVSSNSGDIVKNLLLKADFPVGFEFNSSAPSPFQNKTTWNLGDIEPEGVRKIKIKGTLVGGQSEEKSFHFLVGGQSEESEAQIDKPFLNLAKSVTVKNPFLSIDLFVDGGLQNSQVVQAGKLIQSKVNFKNNLSVPVSDAVIEVKLSGPLINKKTVDASPGFYRSSGDLIRWTKFELPKLELLAPNKNGDTVFNYILFGPFSRESTGLKNQEVLVDITVSGKRLSENNVPEKVESTVKRKIRVETLARFDTVVKHFSGAFKNTGPYPPKVDASSEYTINWTVINSLNDVDRAKVTATLPSYVTWTGKTSPTSEKVSFDPNSRQITWEIGKIFAGGGTAGSLRQVSFQVAFTPSLSQLRTAPNLLDVATFTAHDTFTDTDIEVSNKPVNTAVTTEAEYDLGREYVQE